MSRRTVLWATRPRWLTLRSLPRSTGGRSQKPRKRKRPLSRSGFGLLEDAVEGAEIQVRVAQLVEPVAQRVDVRLEPVDLLGVVLVGLFLLGDQLATATSLFRDRSLDLLPLLGKVA